MDSGIIERIRLLHADIELHRAEIVRQQLLKVEHRRHRMLVDHFIDSRVALIHQKSKELLEMYDDDQFESAQNEVVNTSTAMRRVEGTIAELRAYHRRHPQPPPKLALAQPEIATGPRFTLGENHGKCFDLKDSYGRYVTFLATSKNFNSIAAAVNSKNTSEKNSSIKLRVIDTQVDYESFCGKVREQLQSVPWERKMFASDDYFAYVAALLEYLTGFQQRVYPLQQTDTQSRLRQVELNFRHRWPRAEVPGWQKCTRLSEISAQRAGLWEEKIRLFLDDFLHEEYMNTPKYYRNTVSKSVEELEHDRSLDDENLLKVFTVANNDLLKREHGATPDTVKAGMATHDDVNPDEDMDNYNNPQNLPLDELGNPIPRWLYHLHGLHQTYSCELCNHVYKGEKEFTQHFTELRHLKGLQRIGIPEYTPDFNLITTLKQAAKMYRALESLRAKRPRADDEEIEDVSGVVMSKRQFAALHQRRRQFR